jgi:hypothetical protein
VTRITRADVERQVESVKAAAVNVGAVQLTYSGGLFSELYLQGAYGTYMLQAGTDYGHKGGAVDVGTARGLRDISTFLHGLHTGLDSIRYTNNPR